MTTFVEAVRNAPRLSIDAVEGYGCEAAPLVNYVNVSKKISTEFVLKTLGKKRRVYSWFDHSGTGLYVLINGVETFVTDEVDAMLSYGEPKYGELTPVAQAVTVVE